METFLLMMVWSRQDTNPNLSSSESFTNMVSKLVYIKAKAAATSPSVSQNVTVNFACKAQLQSDME